MNLSLIKLFLIISFEEWGVNEFIMDDSWKWGVNELIVDEDDSWKRQVGGDQLIKITIYSSSRMLLLSTNGIKTK